MDITDQLTYCTDCGMELAKAMLACPRCHRLVHADELRRLAAEAENATQAGNAFSALSSWRAAHKLLPEDSSQYKSVAQRIEALEQKAAPELSLDPSARVVAGSRAAAPPLPPLKSTHSADPVIAKSRKWGGAATGFGAVGLILWKLKFLLVGMLGKGKLLLLGLAKLPTLLSMVGFFGVYWAEWGWRFALGLVISIYIHEMGHIHMLRRYGIAATAPMFIPGLGAFVRLKERPATPVHDARVGLAGPVWGLVAALAAYAVYLGTGWTSWAAVAKVGAWINLFNLLPIWQLDGGRGFRALSRLQRFAIAALLGALWYFSGEIC